MLLLFSWSYLAARHLFALLGDSLLKHRKPKLLRSLRDQMGAENQLGGHDIPSDAVRRRYPRCFRNFWYVYRPVAVDWYMFDNSSASPALTMSKHEFDQLPERLQTEFVRNFVHEETL